MYCEFSLMNVEFNTECEEVYTTESDRLVSTRKVWTSWVSEEVCVATNFRGKFSTWAELDSTGWTSERGTATSLVWQMHGSDWYSCGMHESFSAGSASDWRREEMLEEEGIDTKHGWEAEDRGAEETDSTSGKEGEATPVSGTETASVSVWEAEQDERFCVSEEESDVEGLGFNSFWEVLNTVAQLVGWLSPNSSVFKISCSNPSRTCRNIRGVTLQTSYIMRTSDVDSELQTNTKHPETQTANPTLKKARYQIDVLCPGRTRENQITMSQQFPCFEAQIMWGKDE